MPGHGDPHAERDGYEAVQLAFGPTQEKHLTKAELGHLKKADAPPMRHLVEFRDEAGELQLGETVTVESFEAGARVKVAGISKGKGFQGTIKRHNFASRPEVARLAQRARAGLDRRLRDALARDQGLRGPGRWATGGRPSRASRSSRSMLSRTCCWCAARCPGARGGVVEVRGDA